MPVAITIGKPAQQVEEAVAVEETLFDPRVDEYAALLAWEAKMRKDAKAVRLAELKKAFAAEAAAADESEPELVFEGKSFRLKYGAPANVRTITTEGKIKFANKVGEEAFLQCASIALKDIDQYIAKGEQAEYLEYSKGARSGALEAKEVKK